MVGVEKKLLGVVVVAGQMEAVEIGPVEGQDPRLRVGDGPTGERAHETGEDRVSHPPHKGTIGAHATVAIAIDEVGFVAQEGLQKGRDLGRIVLQVGVELHHEVGPRRARGHEPGAHRRPEPAPGREGQDTVGSGFARHPRRLIA